MKPIPFKIPKSEGSSLKVQIDEGQHFYDRLHYHPEFQITSIKQGEGILYYGNNMTRFQPGDVFVLGTNVPHLMKSSKYYFTEKSARVYSVSLFFDINSFGLNFFRLPELANIHALLHSSSRGIVLKGKIKKDIHHQILNMVTKENEGLIIELLQILSSIQKSNKNFINSKVFNFSVEEKDGQRLNEIIDFTFNHLHEKIRIEDIAGVASLSKSQFSRYFKLHTGNSYIEFLNALRIESACSLLMYERNTIEAICYEVGFNNLSNFNRQFKKLKGVTPSQYREMR